MKKIIAVGSLMSLGVLPTMVVACSNNNDSESAIQDLIFFKSEENILSSNQIFWINFANDNDKNPMAGTYNTKIEDFTFKTVDSIKYNNPKYKTNHIEVPISGYKTIHLSNVSKSTIKNLKWLRSTYVEDGKRSTYYLNPELISTILGYQKVTSITTTSPGITVTSSVPKWQIELHLNSTTIKVEIDKDELDKLNIINN